MDEQRSLHVRDFYKLLSRAAILESSFQVVALNSVFPGGNTYWVGEIHTRHARLKKQAHSKQQKSIHTKFSLFGRTI